jgi:ubiquinone/menaquinone biosynthesis C-methylase UbiE
LHHFLRIYSKQEYLTPGAAETVERVFEIARPDASSLLLDVACGKGEAMCTLAERSGCQVVGVDLWPIFFPHVREKIERRGVQSLARLVQADGKRLPVRDGTFDAAYCIGGPSIVGLDECLGEMARAVKPGGVVVVSDIAWRSKPGELGREWKWAAAMEQTTLDEFQAAIETKRLRVTETIVFPRGVWDVYYAPMREVIEQARAEGDDAFVEENEGNLAMENRAIDEFWDYAMFVARKPV